jgi:hypothetical protein
MYPFLLLISQYSYRQVVPWGVFINSGRDLSRKSLHLVLARNKSVSSRVCIADSIKKRPTHGAGAARARVAVAGAAVAGAGRHVGWLLLGDENISNNMNVVIELIGCFDIAWRKKKDCSTGPGNGCFLCPTFHTHTVISPSTGAHVVKAMSLPRMPTSD